MKNYSFGLVGYQASFNNCSELKVQNKTELYIDKMYWRWSSWWVRLLGAITDVPGDIMCGSHHKNFFYTAEVVAMAVNNSPFLTRLTRAISFNVLLTRLLGSNKTNSNFFSLALGLSCGMRYPVTSDISSRISSKKHSANYFLIFWIQKMTILIRPP